MRGGSSPAEDVVLGISSTSHAAIRNVHRESPEEARVVLAGKLRRFFLAGGRAATTARRYQTCVDTYIEWDGEAAPAEEMPTKGHPVSYDGGVVRARPDVILLDPASGEYEIRVLLWDELTLDEDSAQLIALPAIERVEATYDDPSIKVVKVFHLADKELQEVTADTARRRKRDVERLLRSA